MPAIIAAVITSPDGPLVGVLMVAWARIFASSPTRAVRRLVPPRSTAITVVISLLALRGNRHKPTPPGSEARVYIPVGPIFRLT